MKSIVSKIEDSNIFKAIDVLFFVMLMGASNLYIVKLLYRQATHTDGSWQSDMHPYIQEMLGINEKYNFPYPVMFKTAKFVNMFANTPEWAMVITITIFNLLAMAIVKVLIEKQTETRLLSTVATFCLFFVSMIYGHVFEYIGIPEKYIGVYSPNPWHNHTYMAARPFMILAFVFGVLTLSKYEKEFEKDYSGERNILLYVIFSAAMLLVTMTKPSYTLVHMGAAGIIMVYRLFKNRWKTFRQTILLGICYIPTIVDMLYQYMGVFTGVSSKGEQNGIGIAPFSVWNYYSDNVPMAILLAGAFPIVVLLFHLKDLKNDEQFRFSWQVYLSALLMAIVFYEKGFRKTDGNFMWGYMCGLFIVFLTGIIKLIQDIKAIVISNSSIKDKFKVGIELMLLGAHTLMGMGYFYLITVYGADYF